MRFLAAPVGGAGIAAGQHTGALQPVAGQTGEESLPSRVQAAHGHVAVQRPLGEDAAQHEGCGETDRKETHSERYDVRGSTPTFPTEKCISDSSFAGGTDLRTAREADNRTARRDRMFRERGWSYLKSEKFHY